MKTLNRGKFYSASLRKKRRGGLFRPSKTHSSVLWIIPLCCHGILAVLVAFLVTSEPKTVSAWKQCFEEEGGGICPDFATCCPTGSLSSCVSGKGKYPETAHGQCCDPNGNHGCPYGYKCDSSLDANGNNTHVCRLQEDHPEDLNAQETPAYKLCILPDSMELLSLQAFPIQDSFNATYFSSMGSLLPTTSQPNKFANIETVLVIVHGSGRNADDYLCAGISLAEDVAKAANAGTRNQREIPPEILVIAPKFVSDTDEIEKHIHPDTLYWLEHSGPLPHAWRYGADAANEPHHPRVSSYDVMDHLLEFLIDVQHEGKYWFPKLKRIVVAGHSAGGQYVHRWTLLSSSPSIWKQDEMDDLSPSSRRQVEIRSIVANPRSYCYLDNRRMIRTSGNFRGASWQSESKYTFAVPDRKDIEDCPTYNMWQWGLEAGGDIVAPYRDAVMEAFQNNASALAIRYAQRKVFYLVGEHDTIEQNDRCETFGFQGSTRNERAKLYFSALIDYYSEDSQLMSIPKTGRTHFVHEFHQVPQSPHDHTLMFQSDAGKRAFFGEAFRSDNLEETSVVIPTSTE